MVLYAGIASLVNEHICRKNIFYIYVTEYGTALTTILPILFLYLNTVIVTAGTEPTISLEMPVPSQGHYGFHSFPVVD